MHGLGHALLGAWIAWSDPERVATPPPSTVPADATSTPAADASTSIAALVVRLDGLPFRAFADALQLRAPSLRLHEVGRGDFGPPAAALYAYAVIHPLEHELDAWSVTVIVSDGRAFFRTLQASSADIARVAATTVANLVAAAEAGSIRPDASREMPALDGVSPRTIPAAPADVTTARIAPPLEVAVVTQGVVLLGLGPPADVEVFAGGGGTIGVDVRLPRGAVVGVEARGSTLGRHGHRLSRVRTAVQGGYAWRRGTFELLATALLFVEPWFLSRDGKRVDVDAVGASAPPHVLLGGGVRVGPGGLVDVGPRLRLHVGVHVEASASAMPKGGIGRISVIDADGTTARAFRAGGFELGFGIELLWWLATR